MCVALCVPPLYTTRKDTTIVKSEDSMHTHSKPLETDSFLFHKKVNLYSKKKKKLPCLFVRGRFVNLLALDKLSLC